MMTKSPSSIRKALVLALCLSGLGVGGAAAETPAPAEAKPAAPAVAFDLTYVGNVLGVADGGLERTATYSHSASAGVTAALNDAVSVRASLGWTLGPALSARAIGDVAGVQGTFDGGDALWLYELALVHKGAFWDVSVGRLSSGDAFGATDGMFQFVNSAFSSSGGAISINDPGRAPSPSASWGAKGDVRLGEFAFAGGVFLSDPERFKPHTNGVDFAFRPQDGVLGFAQLTWTHEETVVGVGGYADSGRFQAFDGRQVRGNDGAYAFVETRHDVGGHPVDGFVMLQSAPRTDRSLQPQFAVAGVTVGKPFAGRPDDAVSLGVSSGRFSHRSDLRGTETMVEVNYRFAASKRLAIRPDLQVVINPAGHLPNATVVGVQLEYRFQSGEA
jgi:carbohydrate-selective porin OprB